MITARDQIQAAYASVVNVVAVEGIANRQGIVGIKLIIEPGSDSGPTERRDERVRKWARDQRLRIERHSVDDVAVIDPLSNEVEIERRALVDRSAQSAAQLVQMERRLLCRIGIAGIPEIVCEVVSDRTPEFVGTGLGENLDTAKAQFVVLRRKWVLVDANLAYGVLRR